VQVSQGILNCKARTENQVLGDQGEPNQPRCQERRKRNLKFLIFHAGGKDSDEGDGKKGTLQGGEGSNGDDTLPTRRKRGVA